MVIVNIYAWSINQPNKQKGRIFQHPTQPVFWIDDKLINFSNLLVNEKSSQGSGGSQQNKK